MTNNDTLQASKDEVLETKKKMVSDQIEKILKENGFALMPFIQRTDSADIARVALVADNKPEGASVGEVTA